MRHHLSVLTMAIIGSLLTVSTAAVAAQDAGVANGPSGKITGRVLDESGRPIPNATVTYSQPGTTSFTPVAVDAEGAFVLSDLEPAAYRIGAVAPGYVPAAVMAGGRYFRVGDHAEIRLAKGGVITGTVTGSDGSPVVGVPVQARRVRDGEGKRVDSGFGVGSHETDDRGVYRIYGLAAGSYVVSTGSPFVSGPFPSAFARFERAYHPGSGRAGAAEVRVSEGAETTGVDIRFRATLGHTIKGALTGVSGDGQSYGSVTLRDASGAAIDFARAASREGGGYEFRGVADGEYEVSAEVGRDRKVIGASEPRRVRVRGSDVTGVDLAIAPLGTIEGTVTLERAPMEASCRAKRAAVASEVVINAVRDSGERASLRERATTAAAGKIELSGLRDGTYRIRVSVPGDGWYVDAIESDAARAGERAPRDLARDGIAITRGTASARAVVRLEEGAAGITGRVAAAGRPESLRGARLFVVPEEKDLADAVVRYHVVDVESDGTFAVRNVAPGSYRVLAAAVVSDGHEEDPWLRLHADAGFRKTVRAAALAEGLAIELAPCEQRKDAVAPVAAAALSLEPARSVRGASR